MEIKRKRIARSFVPYMGTCYLDNGRTCVKCYAHVSYETNGMYSELIYKVSVQAMKLHRADKWCFDEHDIWSVDDYDDFVKDMCQKKFGVYIPVYT